MVPTKTTYPRAARWAMGSDVIRRRSDCWMSTAEVAWLRDFARSRYGAPNLQLDSVAQ
jgi:hypothetical protein